MDFPSGYDTKMFSDSRYLALARSFAIWAVVLFLLIAGLVGMLIWTMRATRAAPVLISISNSGATWAATLSGNAGNLKYRAYRAVQESVVGNFAKLWFRISDSNAENEANWCRCERSDCWAEDMAPDCSVCCASGESLYSSFTNIVAGDYRIRAERGEQWYVVPDSIRVAPVGQISENGGLWRLVADVKTNGITQRIEAFVRTARAGDKYPTTLGYYISDFNAYPIGMDR
jgi:hypothetical protein